MSATRTISIGSKHALFALRSRVSDRSPPSKTVPANRQIARPASDHADTAREMARRNAERLASFIRKRGVPADAIGYARGLGGAGGWYAPAGGIRARNGAPLMFRLLDLLPPEEKAARIGQTAARHDLPPGLHVLAARHAQPLLGATRPRIVYPPPDVVMELPEGTSLALEASGEHLPYLWSVNGTPLPRAAVNRTASWQPDGPGFVHVTLTDGAGRFAQEDLELVKDGDGLPAPRNDPPANLPPPR